MSRLRVSAISFLNTAPLMWDFDHGDLRREYQVDYTLPSTCAAMLAAGEADIGIIPVAAYASIPDLVIIPDVAIAARGAVRSILLISKVPVEKIRSVAVDTSSRTSVALLRVLLINRFGGARNKPEFVPMDPKLGPMLKKHDAALLIGDAALRESIANKDANRKPKRALHIYDLAEEWLALTGKSFVFAFWAVRKNSLNQRNSQDVCRAFQSSRDHGLQPDNIARTVREWAVRLKLGESEIKDYLTRDIHYYLERECLAGLKLFYERAEECGAIPSVPNLAIL